MTVEDLKNVQNTQKEILREVIKVCEKNDIDYYMFYGSLIGTVRHSGTIPWDYDIDIAMNRENFERFYSIANKELPENLELQNIQDDDVDYIYETRVINKNTVMYNVNHPERKGHVRIDIFVLDYAKENLHIPKKLLSKFVLFIRTASLDSFERKILKFVHRKSSVKMLFLILTDIFSVVFTSKRVSKLIFKLFCSSTPTDNYSTFYSDTVLYPVADIEPKKFLNYEDLRVTVPNNYDVVLRRYYGDYMKLPPEEERFTSNLDEYSVEF